jgi:hypothetical protein
LRKNTSAVIEALMNSSDTNTTASTVASVRSRNRWTMPSRARERSSPCSPACGSRRARNSAPASATHAKVAAFTSIAAAVPPAAESPPPTNGPAVMPR